MNGKSSLFRPASREQLKLRLAIDGPAGSGKTFTSLRFAHALLGQGGRIAVIDTEHGAASKYQGESPDGVPWEFDVCELQYFAPSTYTQAVREAGRAGYDVLVIDSLSHAWDGMGGALDQVDRKASQNGNSFVAWRDVTPQHREMVESILASPCHIIVTMRSKMEYVLEERVGKNGKKVVVPKKLGMAPIQRQGTEYEFDVVCDIDLDHVLTISKTRCSPIDGARVVKPDMTFLAPVRDWLAKGAPRAEATTTREMTRLAESGGDDDKRTVMRTSDPATSDQVARVKELGAALGMGPADIRRIIARRGAQRIADLSFEQAAELVRKLEAKRAEDDVPF